LDLLEQKKELSDLRGEWEDNFVERSKYIQTKTEPHIFWKPRIPDAKTKELMKKSKKTVEEQFEEAKQSWTSFKRELTSQIEDLKENNNFSGAEENGKRAEKEDKERIPVSKRLVITRRVVNDKRVVLPKESDSKEDQQEDDKKPLTKKERRKEIENQRKRRHRSDSSDSGSDGEKSPKKPAAKKEKNEETPTKDVRRVASKTEKIDDPLPVKTTRRVSLKKTTDDLKRTKKVRKVSSRSTRKRSSSSSSSSGSSGSSSSEAED